MSDMALFELEAPAWAPLYHPRGPWEDRGENAVDATAEEWKAYQRAQRCRDCGTRLSKCKRTHSCGGAGSDGQYDLCDDCAALDGCEERARRWPEQVGPGSHVSRWGMRTSDLEHEHLTRLQAERRAKYLREVAS